VPPLAHERKQVSGYHAPAWLPGAHLQTIYPFLFRRLPIPPLERARWETPDGDFVDVDWLPGRAGAPVVVLFHGLEGCSRSHYARALLRALRMRGWRAAVPHFRGCSGEPNRLPRAYHSGDHDEIDWMLRAVARQTPGVPRFALGVSLGGNALLKWLAREGARASELIVCAAAISAPVDLATAGHRLGRGWNRLYTWNFLRTLKRKSLAKLAAHPDIYDRRAVARARNLYEFDNLVTAPLHGFRDTDDYWTRASSKGDLARIAVPTLILHARNDPFLPGAHLPQPHEVSPAVSLDYPEEGGHVGFVSGPFPGHLDWLPERVLRYFGDALETAQATSTIINTGDTEVHRENGRA
jgi:predicted alpha/beta-fold hydrolase